MTGWMPSLLLTGVAMFLRAILRRYCKSFVKAISKVQKQ